VTVSFDSDEPLSVIDLSISGAESATLTKGDFSETVSSGTYTYTATYAGSSDGDYTATLNTAEDSNGNNGASGQSQTVPVDTTAPSISAFSASNPSGQDVTVSFDSDEPLSTISTSLSGAESATLTKGDFSETVSGGTYTYTATYSGSSDGDYTATLNTAEDSSGNNGASGQSTTTKVTVLNSDSAMVYQGLESIARDGGETSPLNPSGVQALGPSKADLTGDGASDLPYIDSSGNLNISDGTGNTQTLVSDSDPSNPAKSKTLMAVTEWKGSDTSVFYANKNNDKIYRVTDSGSPKLVATPGNGAQAVLGTGDIDGDGTDELLFADGSQQVRYLEPSGTTTELTGAGAASNNGIGVGQPLDFDGDGTVRVPIVTDNNGNLKIVGEAESTKTFPNTNSKKAPITASNVDGDSKPEVVYVSDDGINNGPDSPLRYIDNPFGSSSVELLEDKNGDPIDGDGSLGVVS
jgi:hypothetical protein